MKNVILKLVLVSSAFISVKTMACNPEAQFIGKVKNYNIQQKSESTQECFFEINYSMFNSSYVCPLDIDEASTQIFQDQSCSLKNSDAVSGYMSKSINGNIVIE